MRKKILLGNWKMNKTLSEAVQFVDAVKDQIHNDKAIIAVPDLFIQALVERTSDSPLEIAAQNAHFEEEGAYTGETSPKALADLGVKIALVGHSERRQMFNETDEAISKKIETLLALDMTPVLCIGETLEERRQDQVAVTLEAQLERDLYGVAAEDLPKVIIAYEPIWAIGTGETASPDQANEACGIIRKYIQDLAGQEIARAVSITYGGSVKEDNASDIMDQNEIDGLLVGGASLDPETFIALSKLMMSYD